MPFGLQQLLILVMALPALFDTVNAFCRTGAQFQWGSNSLHENPCEVAGDLLPVCLGRGATISPLKPGSTYSVSQPNGDGNRCFCSSVYYAIISACAQCQGRDWPDWQDQTRNCQGVTFIRSINITIPPDTQLPSWAFLDYPAQGSFNLTAAQADALHLSASSVPTSTLSRTSVQFSPPMTTIAPSSTSPTSTSTVTIPSGISALSGARRPTNIGAIIGGVLGGVAVLFLLIIAFCCLRKRRRNDPMRIDSPSEERGPDDNTAIRTTTGPLYNTNSVSNTVASPAVNPRPADPPSTMSGPDPSESPNSENDLKSTLPNNTLQGKTHNRMVNTGLSGSNDVLAEKSPEPQSGQLRPNAIAPREPDTGTHGSKKLCCK